MTYEDLMALPVQELSTLISKLDLVKPPLFARPTAQETTFLCGAYLDFRGKKSTKGFGKTYLEALAHALVYAWRVRLIQTDWRKLYEQNPFEDP